MGEPFRQGGVLTMPNSQQDNMTESTGPMDGSCAIAATYFGGDRLNSVVNQSVDHFSFQNCHHLAAHNTDDHATSETTGITILKRNCGDALKAELQQNVMSENKRRKKEGGENWDAMYARLVDYKNMYGDTLVPKRYALDPKLGTWVETQRVQYKRLERAIDQVSGEEQVAPNNRLTPERLEKLRAINFAWTAKSVRKKDASSLEADATQQPSIALHAKRPSFNGISSRLNEEAVWLEMYQRLIEYKEREGHCLVPRKYEADPRLAAWVEQQRALWSRENRLRNTRSPRMGKDGSTPASQLTVNVEPREIDLEPPVMSEDSYGIKNLRDGNNHTNFSPGATEKHTSQQTADLLFAEKDSWNLLSQERKAKLEALGFVWSLRNKRIDDHWDTMFRQLVEYKEKYGDCLVPSRWEENPKLGKWIETQRYEYTKLHRSTNDAADGNETDGKSRSSNPRLTEDRIRRLESIGFEWRVKQKMKRYYDKQWDMMFDRLLQFKKEHGHCMVPKRYPQDPKLGTWIHTQRIQYRKLIEGKINKTDGGGSDSADDLMKGLTDEEISFRLTEDRRRRLDEIGFVWSAREGDKNLDQGRLARSSYDNQWDAMFLRLKSFKEAHGHCLVPKRYKDDPKLGTWVDTQRVQYKRMRRKVEGNIDGQSVPVFGKVDELNENCLVALGQTDAAEDIAGTQEAPKTTVGRLTEERIRRLDELGFAWSLRDDWNKHYEELRAFRREHGHCNVPARYSKNRRLGIWVSAQRQQYKIRQAAAKDPSKPLRTSPLTEERIELLNQIGFTWTIRSREPESDMWPHRFQQLKDYQQLNGTCRVPLQEGELGAWVERQCRQYKEYLEAVESGQRNVAFSTTTELRMRQLRDLGVDWDLGKDRSFSSNMVGHRDSFAVEEAAAMMPLHLEVSRKPIEAHTLDQSQNDLFHSVESALRADMTHNTEALYGASI